MIEPSSSQDDNVGTQSGARDSERKGLRRIARALAFDSSADSLSTTLMEIGLEHARATRGLLALLDDGGWTLKMHAHASPDGISIDVDSRPLCADDVSPRVVDDVVRTNRALILDGLQDISTPTSLVCLPLVHQSRLVGLLYFETHAALQPESLPLLEMIAAQAAVAFENARVQAALRDSERRFRSMADAHPDVVWITELSPERVVYASPSFERIWGLAVEELYKDPHLWLNAIHPEDRLRVSEALARWLTRGISFPWEAQYRIIRPDGGLRWIHERGVVILGGQRVSGVSTDITQRRTAQIALRDSETRYALAMSAARDGHWDWLVETDDFYASPRMLEIYGFPPETRFSGREEFLERFPFHPEDRLRWEEAAAAYFAGKNSRFDIELRLIREGEARWIRLSGLLSRDVDGLPLRYTGSVSDVTDRKLAEAALRDSEARFSLAVKASNDGIWDFDVPANTMFMSKRAQRLHGLAPGAVRRPLSAWLANIVFHPEDELRRLTMFEAYLAGSVEHYDGEWRVKNAENNWSWVRIRGLCMRNQHGCATRMAGSISDIDARKRAEAALQQASRLEAVGTLAGGIAHDFNNILGAILGYGDMVLRRTRARSRNRRDLEQIIVAGDRGRHLVERILAFSRTSVGERVPVNVRHVVHEVLGLLAGSMPSNIRLEHALSAADSAVLGDATQMHQMMMNLATNAMQAMPQGGTLSVTLERLKLSCPISATTAAIEPGDYVVLSVADDGSGIAPEILARIFDPFFTTKEVGSGTGLGLSLVHGIVAEFGGALNVRSQVGRGSAFSVFLPYHSDVPAPASARDRSSAAVPRGARETVLVVDDEASLASLLAQTLAGLGYVPVVLGSATQALAALTDRPERFDAVITDERMPGLSGTDLTRAIRRRWPSLPVVLVSGYLGSTIVEGASDAGADAVLRKPVVRAELAQAMASVMAARSTALQSMAAAKACKSS